MRITLIAAHGAVVEFDTDEDDYTVDGMDTLLRQIGDTYSRLIQTDIASGILADVPTVTVTTDMTDDER